MNLTFPINIPRWLQILFGKQDTPPISETIDDKRSQPIDLQSLIDCSRYISQSLEALANKDVIGSCRIHREFGKLKRPTFNRQIDDSNIYLSYLWEGAEKTIETARHISSNPNLKLDLDLNSEIMNISESIDRFEYSALNKSTSDFGDIISKERDYIQFTIATRTKSMKHEDFNDGTLQYSYLVLLYHLHSFLNAASKLNAFRYNQ